jgi:hypothetical protein
MLPDGITRSDMMLVLGVDIMCDPESIVSSVCGRGSHAAVSATSTAAADNPITRFIVRSPNQVAVSNLRLCIASLAQRKNLAS